jgi:hypothetical protein
MRDDAASAYSHRCMDYRDDNWYERQFFIVLVNWPGESSMIHSNDDRVLAMAS